MGYESLQGATVVGLVCSDGLFWPRRRGWAGAGWLWV